MLESTIKRHYDQFAPYYDFVSSKRYYHAARSHAIERLNLIEGECVLNVPCGTGQSFEYMQRFLNGTGTILGVDISEGMLARAEKKRKSRKWTNILFENRSVHDIDREWISTVAPSVNGTGVDAALCDLGLTTFPGWKRAIDTLLSVVRTGGRIAIMDWYIPERTPRARFINWIGEGDVNRPIWPYLKERVADFYLNDTFKGGDVFVASGTVA
jgi:ubiquinone/menaquinone biosynthesis C-methylase UbiE